LELDGFVDDSAGHVADADLLGVVGETPAGTKKNIKKKEISVGAASIFPVSFSLVVRAAPT